jgi:Sulfotransferase family
VTVATDPSLLKSRLRELVPVDQPLVLITQAQRSGGTLLLRLLDGHPECHVVPFQLRGIDGAAKSLAAQPEEAWQALYDPKLAERYEKGHRQEKGDVLRHGEVFSFRLPPDLQRGIYDARAAQIQEPTQRDLLDCYFTSYFNAWLDYRNLRAGAKRWVVGFEPGVARSMRGRDAIRDLYPDGRVLSVVRDPWSWFASARRWEPRWRDREQALDHWCRTGGGTVKWRQKTKPDLRIIRLEDLLGKPKETLRKLAAWLEIEFQPELLQPTFNGLPIRGNSSFADVATGISTRPLERAEDLDAEDVAYIQKRAGRTYKRLLRKVVKDWDDPAAA